MLINEYVGGFFGNISIFIILITIAIHGWIGKSIFSKSLSCHAALIIVCLYGISNSVSAYSRLASFEITFRYYVDVFGKDSILFFLLMLPLLYGCAQSHFDYFKRLKNIPLAQ